MTDREREIESLSSEVALDEKLLREKKEKLNELRDEMAADSCPFAVGDEIERSVKSWRTATPRIERWLVRRVRAIYGGRMVCQRILKSGEMGSMTQELAWKSAGGGSLKKIGHRDIDESAS